MLPIASFGHSFEVKGEITALFSDSVDKNGERRSNVVRTNTFSVSVDGCKVLIVTGQGMDDIAGNVFGTEGKDYSYFLTKYHRRKETTTFLPRQGGTVEVPLKEPRVPLNDATLVLRRTFVPVPLNGLISPVWTAYGSSCYFSNRIDGMIDPLFYVEDHRLQDSIKLRATWSLGDDPPYLLTSLVDYRDGNAVNLPYPFQGETTNSVYQTLQWTNRGKLRIPTEFKITRYAPDLNAKDSPRLRVWATIHGIAREIRDRSATEDFSPQVSATTRVVDHRFHEETRSEHPFAYLATQGRILNLEELIELPGVRKPFPPNSEFRQSRTKTYRFIIYGCFALLLGLPLVFFAKNGWRRIIKQTKTKN